MKYMMKYEILIRYNVQDRNKEIVLFQNLLTAWECYKMFVNSIGTIACIDMVDLSTGEVFQSNREN